MKTFPWQQARPWLLLLAVGLAATWLRFGLIESSAMGLRCGNTVNPAWCRWREWLVIGFLHNVYGVAALVAMVPALLLRSPWLAWLAAALGVFALELYGFESGALALLVGSLRLLQLQAPAAAPLEQNRRRNGEVQSQP